MGTRATPLALNAVGRVHLHSLALMVIRGFPLSRPIGRGSRKKPKPKVVRQLVKQLVYKVYFTGNHISLYLWRIKRILKCCIVSLY